MRIAIRNRLGIPKMLRDFIVIYTALLFPGQAAAVELYKWVDEDGHVHYSDKRPANEKFEELTIKVKSYEGPARITDYSSVLTPDATVRIYTAEWCGVCKRAKKYMDEKKIPYKDLDIEKSMQAKREYKKLNSRGIPVLLVGKQRMNGFSPTKLDAMLEKARSGS